MSDNKSISWTSFCQAMNSIAFWLLQNKKNYKKRDHYQILTLKGNCKDIEKKAKKLGNDKLVSMYTMALIKDNTSLNFLPNYVTLKNGEQIDKAEYVDMAIRTEAYIRANGRLPAIVYRMSKLPDYSDSTMKLFIKTFNYKGNTIDEALAIIAKKKLYSKYFDSQKTDKKTINDAKAGKGSNCVDWGQVYYRSATS
ncbi:pseudomurein-binding repeat-containing protein [Methanobrevibacter sp.]|uniref:pseudomurein-binding repeat-containing protein n=1 Tax=Methanobrevibacter sp. TaxID=66852 RepID=UPI00386E1360